MMSVEIVDIVRDSASPWFTGPCGLVLANPEPLPFWPCRGRLGFFEPLPPALPPDPQKRDETARDDIYAGRRTGGLSYCSLLA
jgi:hypothetical protein